MDGLHGGCLHRFQLVSAGYHYTYSILTLTHFTNFNCGTLPEPLNLSLESNQMRTFIS